ncbi:hypothetical protein COCNU_scaffold006315G000010 [Cocos nucifera]|nr:hypothetical protein [Cocos nucifera]
MDEKRIKMLTKGLQAYKRKGKALIEILKKVRIDIPSSTAPVNATAAPKVAGGIEVVPTVMVGTANGTAMPSTTLSPPTKVQVSKVPMGGEKREKRKEKKKSVTIKAWCKARPNHQLLAHIKMVNRLRSEALKAQEDHQAKINHFQKEKAIEVDRLTREKAVETRVL